MPASGAAPLPPFILELGANLLASCPAGGVLLVGTDLEALSVWYDHGDLLRAEDPFDPPRRYATDSLYRRRMAEAMETDPGLPIRNALTSVAARRPLCLSPTADSAAAPALTWTASRLARVSRPVPPGSGSALDHRAARRHPAGRVGLGRARCAECTTAPPATTRSSAAASFSSSETRRRRPAGRDGKGGKDGKDRKVRC